MIAQGEITKEYTNILKKLTYEIDTKSIHLNHYIPIYLE